MSAVLSAHKAQALHHAPAVGELRPAPGPTSLTGGRPGLLRKGRTRRKRRGQWSARKVRGRRYRPLARHPCPHGKSPGSGRKSQAADSLGHAGRIRRQSQQVNRIPFFKGKLQGREPPRVRPAVFTEQRGVGLRLWYPPVEMPVETPRP